METTHPRRGRARPSRAPSPPMARPSPPRTSRSACARSPGWTSSTRSSGPSSSSTRPHSPRRYSASKTTSAERGLGRGWPFCRGWTRSRRASGPTRVGVRHGHWSPGHHSVECCIKSAGYPPLLLAFSRERAPRAAAVASLKQMPARQSTRLVLFASIQVRMRARSGALLCAETMRPPAHLTDGACGATLIGHDRGPNDARGGHRRRRVPVGDAARPLLLPGARRRLRHVLCLERSTELLSHEQR